MPLLGGRHVSVTYVRFPGPVSLLTETVAVAPPSLGACVPRAFRPETALTRRGLPEPEVFSADRITVQAVPTPTPTTSPDG